MNEVNKGISDITWVVMIDGKVQKIDFHFMIFANLFKKHFFWVFIRNVSNHESSPSVELNLSNTLHTLSGIILYS
jgi:hypothetical protein